MDAGTHQMIMDAWWLANSVPAATVLVSLEHARDSRPGRFPETVY